MNTNNATTAQTAVQQVDINLDEWLGAPGAESILNPVEEPENKKTSIFSNAKTDLSFLDKEEETEDNTTDEEDKKPAAVKFDDIISEVEETEEDETVTKKGRPKTEKSGLVEFLKKRIESKEMFAFDDYDENEQDLDEYLAGLSEKDVDELWKANVDNLKNEVASNTPKEFFESLPEELQYAAKYVMDGGQDLKSLFQALAQVEQVRDLNIESEGDQEFIIRQYLQATNFGDDSEIAEEIETWKDLGVLEKKAKQFKPKLDTMQEEIVAAQLAEQEERKAQQEQAAERYVNNVFEALRAGEINGLKLDKKTQANLYTGLVKPQYPSMSGRPTNLLGHLLEKHQFVEPNYPLIAEALWLLSNPDEYRQNIAKQGKTAAVEETVRTLKTEQSRKNATTSRDDSEAPKTRKLPRNTNFFKR
jgi:hypothetical protein